MAVTYSDIKFVKHPNLKYLCVCHSGKGNFSIRGLPLEENQVYKLISLCDSCRGFNRMVFCFTSLPSYTFKSIIAPISNLLCLYVRRRQHRHICLRAAHKDPERLIVGTEMRSRPYLVLVESHISLSVGFMLSVLRPISSISRVPGAGKHSSTQRMSGVRMPERARTGHICAISSASAFCSTLSQQPIFSTASLKMTRTSSWHLLNLIISKLRGTLKAAFKLKCPC